MKAYFEKIRPEILDKLKQSKKSVKIAMAWFTNRDLFKELLNCLEKEVSVELIIQYDFINFGPYRLNFQTFIDKGGLLFFGEDDHPMHHKFAVIDEHEVITGSYNWTYYAESLNKENIISIKDEKLANQYLSEFKNLTQGPDMERVSTIVPFVEEPDEKSILEYLAYDLYAKYRELRNETDFTEALRLKPTNNFYRIRRLKESLGISARINDKENQFAVIIPKGTEIPITQSRTFSTSEDDQTAMSIKAYSSNDDEIYNEKELIKTSFENLPKKKRGEVNVLVEFSIDKNGRLSAYGKSEGNRNALTSLIDINYLLESALLTCNTSA